MAANCFVVPEADGDYNVLYRCARELDSQFDDSTKEQRETYYLHDDKASKFTLPDDARIRSSMYGELAADAILVFPHANEREFSAKRKFENLKLPPKFVFTNHFQRQYYEFNDNHIGYCPHRKMLIFDNDAQSILLNNLIKFKVIMRIDRVFKNENVYITTKVRLFHKKIRCGDKKNTVTCSMAHENKMHQCFDFIKNLDMSKWASKIRNIYAYFIRIAYDDESYVFRIAFRFDVNWTGVETENCEIDIECEDPITYKLFLQISTCIFEYFDSQYTANEDGRIDELLFKGARWHDFKNTLNDADRYKVLQCLEKSVHVLDVGCIKCPDYDVHNTVYDDFVNFIAVKNLYEHEDKIKSYIDENSEKLYPLTTMIKYI